MEREGWENRRRLGEEDLLDMGIGWRDVCVVARNRDQWRNLAPTPNAPTGVGGTN